MGAQVGEGLVGLQIQVGDWQDSVRRLDWDSAGVLKVQDSVMRLDPDSVGILRV